MAEGSALGQRDPYHVIQFQLEEGGDDPVQSRRGWEEAKAETKRVAQMVEREQRTTAKIEATLAAQQAQKMRLQDLSKQLRSLQAAA